MSLRPAERTEVARAALARGLFFFAFWLAISGWKAADLPVGLLASAAATWTSLKLLPARRLQFRFGAALIVALSFFRGSIVAGFDVARRALRRDLDLRPGFVTAPLRLPPGDARNAFSSLSSLMPGTLPVGMDSDSLLIHGLDVGQPIAQDLAREEDLFIRAFGDASLRR